VGIVAVILVFRDPVGSGHMVSQVLHAVTTLLGNVK
jgi:hypothetical protein